MDLAKSRRILIAVALVGLVLQAAFSYMAWSPDSSLSRMVTAAWAVYMLTLPVALRFLRRARVFSLVILGVSLPDGILFGVGFYQMLQD
jgi:hypothetical protein